MSIPSPWSSGNGYQDPTKGTLTTYRGDGYWYYATSADGGAGPATQINIFGLDTITQLYGTITGFTNIAGIALNLFSGGQYLYVADAGTNTITKVDLFTGPPDVQSGTYTQTVIYTHENGTEVLNGITFDTGLSQNSYKLFASIYDPNSVALPSTSIIMINIDTGRLQANIPINITLPSPDNFGNLYVYNDVFYTPSASNYGLYSGLLSYTYGVGVISSISVTLTLINTTIYNPVAVYGSYIYGEEGNSSPTVVNAYNIADGTFSSTIGYAPGYRYFIPFINSQYTSPNYPGPVLFLIDISGNMNGTNGNIYQYSLTPPGPSGSSGPSGSTGSSGGVWSTGYNAFNTGKMASDGTYLYVDNSPNMAQTSLADGSIVNPAVAENFNNFNAVIVYNNIIYVASDTIWSYDISNNYAQTDYVPNFISNPIGLAVIGDYLYVAGNVAGGPSPIGRITLSNPSSNDPTWLSVDNNTYGGSIYGMCSYNNMLYALTDRQIITITVEGVITTIFNSMPADLFAQWDIVVYNDIIYATIYNITDEALNSIATFQLDGTLIDIAWQTVPYADSLAINGTDLYCSANTDSSATASEIYKFALSGPPPPPPAPMVCFKEGSQILTDKGYRAIEDLRKGDLVKTSLNGLKAIEMIGKREITHLACKDRIKDQLYVCGVDKFPQVFEDLVITGCHSILVDDFASEQQRQNAVEVNGNVYVTDKKYRLPACVDDRTKVYDAAGDYTIYHIALENEDYYMNYGVYANGLLVETCSRRYLKELSNMTLIE